MTALVEKHAAYAAWIAAYREKTKVIVGMCGSATLEMVAAFPELRRVAGWAVLAGNGLQPEHFWCEAEDGTVLDPTSTQWADPVVSYVPFQPGDEVRVGRCMECGWDIYRRVQSLNGDRESFCSAYCRELFVADMEGRKPVLDGLKAPDDA